MHAPRHHAPSALAAADMHGTITEKLDTHMHYPALPCLQLYFISLAYTKPTLTHTHTHTYIYIYVASRHVTLLHYYHHTAHIYITTPTTAANSTETLNTQSIRNHMSTWPHCQPTHKSHRQAGNLTPQSPLPAAVCWSAQPLLLPLRVAHHHHH
jgi:hypothetical protein